MKSIKKESAGKPLTVNEWRVLYRSMATLVAEQENQIKEMNEWIQALKSKPTEEENKILKAKNKVLMNEIQKLQENEIDRLLRDMGRAPREPNPSEVYLSISASER